MLDLNRTVHKEQSANEALNAVIDATIDAEIGTEKKRDYLGASSLGDDCLRKMQLDWSTPKRPEPRIKRIFDRGHWVEDYMAGLLTRAGFRLVRNSDRIAFSQLDGRFKGHGDGMPILGPAVDGLGFPCLWENKGLGSKGWTKLQKEGLKKSYPKYYVQCQQYMAYFDLTDHPTLFTAVNMDTMHVLYLLIKFNPEVAQAWSDKAVTIVRAQEVGEDLPKVATDRDDWRCKMCSHRETCWGVSPT